MTYHGEDSATADDASVFISHLARKRLWTPEHLEITAASDGASFNRDVWRIEPQQTEILSQRIGADDALLFVLLNPSARAVLANLPQRHLCCNRCPAPNALRQVTAAESAP